MIILWVTVKEQYFISLCVYTLDSQNPQSAEEGARIRKLETHWSVEQDTMKKKLEVYINFPQALSS